MCERLDNSYIYGNSQTSARYDTECEEYILYQYSGEGGAFRYKNLRLCTYELQSAKVTAIKSMGKNLYNKAAIEEKGYIISEDNALKTGNYKSVFIDVRGLDSITISNNAPNNYAVQAFVLNSKEVGSQSREGNIAVYNDGKTISLKSSNYIANYVCISIWGTSFDTVAPYIQVEIGDTATEYVPYREPITYTLPEAITSSEEYGLGVVRTTGYEYVNTIDFEDKKYYPNRVKKYVYDGTEAWEVQVQGATGDNVYVTPYIPTVQWGISNHYINIPNNKSFENTSGDTGVFLLNAARVRVKDASISSLEEFKAKLAEWAANGNPLTVVCGFDDDTAEDIDIDDNVIEVEPGGSLVAVNEYGLDALTKVSYIVSKGGNA
jgi:hypothetical protein